MLLHTLGIGMEILGFSRQNRILLYYFYWNCKPKVAGIECMMISMWATCGSRNGKDVGVVTASGTTINHVVAECWPPCTPTAGPENQLTSPVVHYLEYQPYLSGSQTRARSKSIVLICWSLVLGPPAACWATPKVIPSRRAAIAVCFSFILTV